MGAPSFIVVGAGMVGAACALRLQSAGYAVRLIDPGPATRAASFGNAGHIAVEQVEPLASWETLRSAPASLFALGGPLDFRLSDVAAWGAWAARYLSACRDQTRRDGVAVLGAFMQTAVADWRELLSLAGATSLMIEDGHALLWFDARQVQHGRHHWSQADTGPTTIRSLSADEIARYRQILPERPPVGGLHFDGTARLVSPQGVRDALIDAFTRAGGERLADEVEEVSPHGAVHLKGGRQLTADRVLIAAGVRSAPLMRRLGAPTPLIAERGYSIQFPVDAWPTDLPTAVLESEHIVLAPQAEGLRATSYVEFALPDSPPDPGKWDRLIACLRGHGLVVPEDCGRWIGCRPTLPDYRPAIGVLAGTAVLYAFGHQHLGVTLSAATARMIIALVEGRSCDSRLDIRRFSP